MKHTIKTAAGALTIQPGGKPEAPFVLVTIQRAPWPAMDLTIKPEDAALLAFAFGQVAKSVGVKA